MEININKIIFILTITFISYLIMEESISADEGKNIFSGVIIKIINNTEEELESFEIVDNKGNKIEIKVSSEEIITEYGLENITGERWISNQKESPRQASNVLKDHQQRFMPVTVTTIGTTALKVVEKEERNLNTNLGYLSVVFGVAWLSFLVYIYIIEKRHKILENKIKNIVNE